MIIIYSAFNFFIFYTAFNNGDDINITNIIFKCYFLFNYKI